jgi:ferredoxin
MKATIDADTCTACELCVDTCSAVFELADDVVKVKVEAVPADAEASCKEAAENCPVEAIKIEE